MRKNKGKRHIKERLWQAGIDVQKQFDCTLDEMIDSIGAGLIDGKAQSCNEVSWLQLAVEARTKKYGNDLPKSPKDKARQLRFLQYRGFETGICFDALGMTMADFKNY